MIERTITWEPRPGGRRMIVTEHDPEAAQRLAEEQRRHMQARCPCCGQVIHGQQQLGFYKQDLANQWSAVQVFPFPGLRTQGSLFGGLFG